MSVLLGNGNGTFQAAVNFPTGAGPNSVAVADVNGDGKPDLIVANYYGSTVSVLLGNGNGTFQAPVNFATGVGQLRGRGRRQRRWQARPDRRRLRRQHRERVAGQWQRHLPGRRRTSPPGRRRDPWRWRMSTATANPIWSSPTRASNSVSVLLGNGNGTFQAASNFATGVQPYSVAVARFEWRRQAGPGRRPTSATTR